MKAEKEFHCLHQNHESVSDKSWKFTALDLVKYYFPYMEN